MGFNSPQVHEAGGFDVTNLVDPSDIEIIVGAKRDETFHIGWFNSPGGIFYILHSQQCVSSEPDLRDCEYSKSLDEHWVDVLEWTEGVPRFIKLGDGQIEPMWHFLPELI